MTTQRDRQQGGVTLAVFGVLAAVLVLISAWLIFGNHGSLGRDVMVNPFPLLGGALLVFGGGALMVLFLIWLLVIWPLSMLFGSGSQPASDTPAVAPAAEDPSIPDGIARLDEPDGTPPPDYKSISR